MTSRNPLKNPAFFLGGDRVEVEVPRPHQTLGPLGMLAPYFLGKGRDRMRIPTGFPSKMGKLHDLSGGFSNFLRKISPYSDLGK